MIQTSKTWIVGNVGHIVFLSQTEGVVSHSNRSHIMPVLKVIAVWRGIYYTIDANKSATAQHSSSSTIAYPNNKKKTVLPSCA